MSNEVKTKEKVDMDPKYIIKLTVTLFLTCLVVAAALGGVNAITADKIAAINWENTQAAMKAVVADPENTEFSDALELSDDMTAAAASAGGTLDSVYEVLVGGENDGYAIKVIASGSQGNIEMMVGLDADGIQAFFYTLSFRPRRSVLPAPPCFCGTGRRTWWPWCTPPAHPPPALPGTRQRICLQRSGAG